MGIKQLLPFITLPNIYHAIHHTTPFVINPIIHHTSKYSSHSPSFITLPTIHHILNHSSHSPQFVQHTHSIQTLSIIHKGPNHSSQMKTSHSPLITPPPTIHHYPPFITKAKYSSQTHSFITPSTLITLHNIRYPTPPSFITNLIIHHIPHHITAHHSSTIQRFI